MTDKEFLENLITTEKIIKRGYKKIECKTCNGKGVLVRYNNELIELKPVSVEERAKDRHSILMPCYSCHGNKHHWVKEPSNSSPD